jgi:hypothetical protein
MILHAIVARYGGVEMMGPKGSSRKEAMNIGSSLLELAKENENEKRKRIVD